MFRFPHAVGPALRRPRVLGPRVGGVCEHRVGLPTLYFTLCRTLNVGSPTAASRDASDACPKHSRTSHRGGLRPLQTETYQNLLTARVVNETRRAKPQKSTTTLLIIIIIIISSSAPVPVTLCVRVPVRVATITNVAALRAPPLRAPDAADGAARARVEGERLRHERVVLSAEAVRCGDFRRRRVGSTRSGTI